MSVRFLLPACSWKS